MYRLLPVDSSSVIERPLEQSINALIPAIRKEIPEIELASRFFYGRAVILTINKPFHSLDAFYFAEPDFSETFDFPLLTGESNEVLKVPDTAVISASYANYCLVTPTLSVQ